jgi:hypothetical protein
MEEILKSPGFWFGVFFFFMVIGAIMTAEGEPRKKKK